MQGWHWSVSSLFILPREKNKAEIKISAIHREKLIFFYSLYNQSTADPDTDNENLPSKLLFSCTDPRGVFVSARRGMIPTALSICSIVATRRFSSLIVSFKQKKKKANFKGRAFLDDVSENKVDVTTETKTDSAWSPTAPQGSS